MSRIGAMAAAAMALVGAGTPTKPDSGKPAKRQYHGGVQYYHNGRRPAETYRGFRRNKEFGRKPTGNTKPSERFDRRGRRE